MKNYAQLVADITRRLTNTWHTDLFGDTTSWPHAFPLGKPLKADLDRNLLSHNVNTSSVQGWARSHGVKLEYENRRVLGTLQVVPKHVVVPDLATAAVIAAEDWPQRLATATARTATLRQEFPALIAKARFLRSTIKYDDLDFGLLLVAAEWFNHNNATGLTPRQVPIPGFHAKWLDTHQTHILALTGRDTLGLLPRHPARIHFTYLDPNHRARGGRWQDSATVGDPFTPAYQPTVVVISENKDTAIHFPPTPGGIAVEGDGFGGKTAAAFGWLTGAPRLYYWGDIDAHGYEILNGYRADQVPVTSILMDPTTYDTYEPFGTNTGKNNKPITAGTRKPLPHLTDPERTVYERLTDPNWTGHRRVEQERIPLSAARTSLRDPG